MRPPLSLGNSDVQRRLVSRLSKVINVDEEPLAPYHFAGCIDLDDAPDHVGRDRDISGDALGGRLR